MAFPRALEQQIAFILQSKYQQILKMPRHEQESRTQAYRSIRQCRRTRQVVPGIYQSFVCGVHRLFISWHIQDRYYDYYYH